MGYIRGLVHGTLIGTAVGLCVAPQDGARTREQVRRGVDTARVGVDRAQATARRMAPAVHSVANGALEMVGTVRHKVARDEPAEPVATGNGRSRR